MWRQAGFEEMLVSPAKRDQNEMGTPKNEIGFDVHHIYEHIDVKDWKTRPIMVEKCQNVRNEIKTRWGDSANLLYWGYRINKSRRSYGVGKISRSNGFISGSIGYVSKSLLVICSFWLIFSVINLDVSVSTCLLPF